MDDAEYEKYLYKLYHYVMTRIPHEYWKELLPRVHRMITSTPRYYDGAVNIFMN